MLKGALLLLALLVGVFFDQGDRRFQRKIRNPAGEPTAVTGLDIGLRETGDVKVLLVHGMGPQKTGDTRTFSNAIAAELGFGRDSGGPDTPIPLPAPALPVGAKPAELVSRVYTATDTAGRHIKLTFYELTWAPLLASYKAALLDDEASHEDDRVGLNRYLKRELMNQRLTDPVMYVGTMGPYVRNAAKHATCLMMGGKFEQAIVGKEQCVSVPQVQSAVAVITWSLGSRVAFDAVDELKRTSPDAAGYLASRTFSVYMLANQLPLLELAAIPRPSETSLLETIGVVPTKENTLGINVIESFMALRANQSVRIRLPLTIVAVSDPNDLLSYPIPSSFAKQHSAEYQFINVLTPVTRKYVSGSAANPLGAHTNHSQDRFVRRMIARGAPGQ